MNSRLGTALALGSCLAIIACAASPDSPVATTQPPADPAIAQTEPATRSAVPADSLIATTPLQPAPIKISLADLPQPYASSSASQSPQVVAIPQNPTLAVPPGFTVNVFAEGLDAPRWLALTPEGDVLVTETRQNQIRRLPDSNGDGVADQSSVFANASNGLNIPFGMAFSDDAFFLGNTDAVLRFPYESSQGALTGRGKAIAQLPGNGYRQHWTRNVAIAPDQSKLYVSIGSQSNINAARSPGVVQWEYWCYRTAACCLPKRPTTVSIGCSLPG